MRVLWIVAVVLVCGCTQKQANEGAVEQEFPPQVSEKQQAESNVPPGSLAFGDACQFAEDCTSNVCLHVDIRERLAGRVCSQPCGLNAGPCPSGSHCVQVLPTEGSEFCVVEVTP